MPRVPDITGPGLIRDFQLAIDPVAFSCEIGLSPYAWQERLLQSRSRRIFLNCSRQSGKTTTLGTLEAHGMIYTPGGLQIVNVAPGLRQSRELFRKVMAAYRSAGKPVKSRVENKLELELVNDSRAVALPGSEATIRGLSGIDWLVFEEAARIPDVLYFSVRPMIATRPDARIILLSTPFGKRGFYHAQWLEIVSNKLNAVFGDIIGQTDPDEWEYFEVPATDCPRIAPKFLAHEKAAMGEWWFEQEYGCQFKDAQTAAFREQDIVRLLGQSVETWQF
jgi:hypothetical protein